MDCEQALQLISKRLDREDLPADESIQLEAHLAECAACRSSVEAFQAQDAELRQAYTGCETCGTTVAERVIARVRSISAPAPWIRRLFPARTRELMPRVAVIAAMAASVLFLLWWMPARQETALVTPDKPDLTTPGQPDRASPAPGVDDFLTARKRPEGPAVKPVAVGEEVRTASNERRRATLVDGSILYLNENTVVRVESDRKVTLSRGEVFLEVAPLRSSTGNVPFVIKSAGKDVTALGTKFAVQAKDAGPGVVVTQGKVQVSGVTQLVHAGQELKAGSESIVPAPRATHTLDWTRDLMTAAESPLVPRSEHCGGRLIAIDPSGQEFRLEMRKYKIDVHIEDGFARTTIDQTYFNHQAFRTEGTFYFPLPPDASLSRLAMYVTDGTVCNLNEGGMCERQRANEIYTEIVRRMQDPALLEWVDGTTFKMRVFPLEGRQEKRIIMSYTQRLDSLYGKTTYRFPGGHNMQLVRDWSFHARIKDGEKLKWKSATHDLKPSADKGDLVLDTSEKNTQPNKDVELTLSDAKADSKASRFALAEHEGAKYLMLRYRPELPAAEKKKVKGSSQRDWVFLFETSGDRDPLLARVQIDVVRTFLNNAEHDDTFRIVTAGSRIRTFADEAKSATPENIKAGVEFLEKRHLVGALDMGQALNAVKPLLSAKGNPCVVHVGSGIGVLGERKEDVLAKMLPENVPYVGVGIGKRWSRSFMKLAAERSGGSFAQINPDEEVGWRAFELFATLQTPRLQNLKVVDNAEKVKFLPYVTTVAQGEEVCAIARVDKDGVLPEAVSVSGAVNGKTFTQELKVEKPSEKANYLPRTWAKLEIDRLLAEDQTKHKTKIVELSKAMYVMTPFTSLLVLENEAMYQQYNVDRGRKDHWAMYDCPATIPIVYEPDASLGVDIRNAPRDAQPVAGKLTRDQVLNTILVRIPARLMRSNYEQHYGYQALTAGQIRSGSYGNMKIVSPTDYTITGFDMPTITSNTQITMTAVTYPWGQIDQGGPGGVVEPSDWAPASRLKVKLQGERKQMDPMLPGRSDVLESLAGAKTGSGSSSSSGDKAISTTTSIGPRLEKKSMSMLKDMDGFKEERLIDSKGDSKEGKDRFDRPSKPSAGKSMKKKAYLDDSYYATDLFNAFVNGYSYSNLIYQRPYFSNDQRLWYDLISYAPGMNTTEADIEATLEAEAGAAKDKEPGTIDPEAAKLIEKARSAGWQALTVKASAGDYVVTFNGAGQFTYERTLSSGLKEQVVCDGKSLWQLYPELQVGAKRTMSRFHRAEFARLMPGTVRPAEDLARGANLKVVGERTVAIQPNASKERKLPEQRTETRLVFGKSGRLVKRQRVEQPSGKVLAEERYDKDGTTRFVDAEDKVVEETKATLKEAKAPTLVPETKSMLVLALPYRTQEHFQRKPNGSWKEIRELDEAGQQGVFAANCIQQNSGEGLRILKSWIMPKGDKLPGYFVFLTSHGATVQTIEQQYKEDVLDREKPLGKYLSVIADQNRGTDPMTGHMKDVSPPKTGFLAQLAEFRNLIGRFYSGKYNQGTEEQRKIERERIVKFVQESKSQSFAWALVYVERQHLNDSKVEEGFAKRTKPADEADLSWAERYERAVAFYYRAKYKEALEAFKKLHAAAVEAGRLPPIDGTFRSAFTSSGQPGQEAWETFVRDTATKLIENHRHLEVLMLASQCQQLGDQPLAEVLVDQAQVGVGSDDKLTVTMAAVAFHWRLGHQDRADGLLDGLLKDDNLKGGANLWRLVGQLAQQRQKWARALACFDKAMDIEYHELPAIINIQKVRTDYQQLLATYQQVAHAYRALDAKPPADFIGRVIRAVDRWRALETDSTQPCQMASVILRQAGEHELAWDYLTTPAAFRPNEASPYLGIAQTLRYQNEPELTDKAYALASAAEPTNAQIIWDRAQALHNAGKFSEAQEIYRKLAEGDWGQQYQWIQQQAKYQVNRTARKK